MAENISVRVAKPLVAAQVSFDTGLIGVLLMATSISVGFVVRALLLKLSAVVVLDLGRALEILETHTTVSVPDQVAVHDPGAWVVGLETDDSPTRNEGLRSAATEKQSSVSSDGVVEVELSNHVRCENTTTLSEDGEVVSVKMHGVRSLEVVLDHEIYPRVGGAIEHDGISEQGAVVGQARQCGQGL